MTEYGRELSLNELPQPPLYRLTGPDGRDVFEQTEVGSEPAMIAALFSDRELAGEFSAGAAEHGMGSFYGAAPSELPDWNAVVDFAASEADYVLVVTGDGAGLFHADDVAHAAAGRAEQNVSGLSLPLYVLSNERGEAPLISVEESGGEVLIAALFTSPERARIFHELAPHLSLPDRLGTIEDLDGLRRHALVAREAGASYAVIDPESGEIEAIPIEELAT